MLTIFDVETSRFPDGNPYRKSSELISWALFQRRGLPDQGTCFGYYQDADFKSRLRERIGEATTIVVINGKFDIGWLKREGIDVPPKCRIWDCQLAEFIMSGQEHSFASMDQLCERYGIGKKEGDVSEYWDAGVETRDIPRPVLEAYNRADIERTALIYEAQLADERLTPAIKKLVLLGGADLLVLQSMEQNGIKFDSQKSLSLGQEAKEELNAITVELNAHIPDGPSDFNWDSGDDLSSFLYGGTLERETWETFEAEYKSGPNKGQVYVRRRKMEPKTYSFPGIFKPLERTNVARSKPERPLYSVAEPILRQLKGGGKLGKRVIELLLKRAELGKLADTYYFKLPNLIEKSKWGGYVHGQYNQVVARTGRLSSSKPNMQNNPEAVDRLFVTRYD